MIRWWLPVAAVMMALPVTAAAQSRPAPRVVIGAGITGAGGGSLGSTDATYQQPNGTPYVLFTMTRRVTSGLGLIGHLQVRVTRHVWIEGSGAWTAPHLETAITNDVEAAAATASQRVSQFQAGGGLIYVVRPEARVRPFFRIAGGWLRQLSDDQTLHQDGWSGDAGGGVQYVWADRRGRFTLYGLRADAGVSVRDGGLPLVARQRLVTPVASVTLMVKF